MTKNCRDYPRFGDKKVLSAIQIITEGSDDNYKRVATAAGDTYDTTDVVDETAAG